MHGYNNIIIKFSLSLFLCLSGELHWRSGSRSLALWPPMINSSKSLQMLSIKILQILSERLHALVSYFVIVN